MPNCKGIWNNMYILRSCIYYKIKLNELGDLLRRHWIWDNWGRMDRWTAGHWTAGHWTLTAMASITALTMLFLLVDVVAASCCCWVGCCCFVCVVALLMIYLTVMQTFCTISIRCCCLWLLLLCLRFSCCCCLCCLCCLRCFFGFGLCLRFDFSFNFALSSASFRDPRASQFPNCWHLINVLDLPMRQVGSSKPHTHHTHTQTESHIHKQCDWYVPGSCGWNKKIDNELVPGFINTRTYLLLECERFRDCEHSERVNSAVKAH